MLLPILGELCSSVALLSVTVKGVLLWNYSNAYSATLLRSLPE